jgi:aromatic ring-opening dioxygenase catalytic subunit (LigB family)
MKEKQINIVYFSHGGGPLPILGDSGHQAMINFMTHLPDQLPKSEAILVISAHWEQPQPTILGAAKPPMFYDYYGFPPAAYKINYPAPGHPELANQIVSLLQQAGMKARVDLKRGFDHGLFIPLSLMYPSAEIPAIQISLVDGLSPALHIELGKILGQIAIDNLLVIGSGFSFHNMSAFFHHDPGMISPRNEAFQDWLVETITAEMLPSERESRLTAWEAGPYARYCHPREEHLLPLHVCAGMAERSGRVLFDDRIMGVRCVAFGW